MRLAIQLGNEIALIGLRGGRDERMLRNERREPIFHALMKCLVYRVPIARVEDIDATTVHSQRVSASCRAEHTYVACRHKMCPSRLTPQVFRRRTPALCRASGRARFRPRSRLSEAI